MLSLVYHHIIFKQSHTCMHCYGYINHSILTIHTRHYQYTKQAAVVIKGKDLLHTRHQNTSIFRVDLGGVPSAHPSYFCRDKVCPLSFAKTGCLTVCQALPLCFLKICLRPSIGNFWVCS